MSELNLLVDFYRRAERQGPGGAEHTRRALELARLPLNRSLKIADLGCGTGASTLILAQSLQAEITAVDIFPEFLEDLKSKASRLDLSHKIKTQVGSMEELGFSKEELDVIWSEGAVYNIGFENAAKLFRPFLKEGGSLIVSEITWFTNERPQELEDYWNSQYSEIDTASAKFQILEKHGYSPEAYFQLPTECWLKNYYEPMENQFDAFLKTHSKNPEAKALIESEKQEIALYRRFSDYYGYGFYIARKI